jgi:hypothetical protein
MKKNSTPTLDQSCCTAPFTTSRKSNNTLLKTTLLLLVGLVSFSKISAQYSGTISLPSGSFTGANALRDMIDSLNQYGLSGNLTVNVTAAYTAPTDGFSLGSAALNNSMAGRTLTFNGNGNTITAPVGTRTFTTTVGFSGVFDFIWCIRGTDNVTINNFTFLDPSSNATTAQQMEAVIAMFNLGTTASSMDGCHNIRITNNSFNMSNINDRGSAIQAIPFTRLNATSNTWADFLDIHRDLTITGNTMVEGYTFFRCRSATTNFKLKRINVSNNTLNNVGGIAVNAAYGVWAESSDTVTCMNNTIVMDSTHTTGVFYGAWIGPAFGSSDISKNTVILRKGQTSSNTCYGLFIQPNGASTEAVPSEIRINANTVRIDSIFAYPVASSLGTWYGTYLSSPYNYDNSVAKIINLRCIIDSNKFENSVLQGAGVFYGYFLTGNTSAGNPARLYFRDNKLTNIRRNGNPSTTYGVLAQSFIDSVVISRNIFDSIRCEVVTASANSWNYLPIQTSMTVAGANNVIISDNKISNIYVTGNTTGSHQIGCQIRGFGHKIFNNRIHNCFVRATPASGSGGGTIIGLFITSNSPGMQIYNNVIDSFHVSNSNGLSTTGSAFGINVQSSGTFDIYNNYIGDFFTPHTNSTNGMFGINANTTAVPTVFNIYNNTISFGRTGTLTGTASSSAFGGAGVYFQNSATANLMTLKNNIIDINATPGSSANWACVKRSSGSHGTKPVNFLSASSNNTYRINSGMQNYYYVENTGTSVTNGYAEWATNGSSTNDAFFDGACSAYKGFMLGEAATVSNTETWVAGPVANTFVPSGTTLSESSSDPIPFITTDLNGSGRGANPDRGALQFSGTGTDIYGPKITYLDIPNLFCITNPSLSAEIVDVPSSGTVNTTSGTRPRLYFKKSTETNTFSAANTSAGNGWKWVEASNTSSPFIFNFDYSLLNSAIAVGNTIQYFIIAQDNVGTANVSIQGATLTGGCPASVNIAGTAAITGAANTKSFSVNNNPPVYSIEHTPITSCQGDTMQLRVVIDSSAAVMKTYSLATIQVAANAGGADIDTFTLGTASNYSACNSTSGLTPGVAGFGLPASIADRYANYVTTSSGTQATPFTDLFAGTSVNFRTSLASFGSSVSGTTTSTIGIMIDYNRNGVLESPAELAFTTTYIQTLLTSGTTCTPTNNVSGVINVPSTAVPGPTLCRVMALVGTSTTAPTPTTTATWGEVEDYIVMQKVQPDPNFTTHKWMSNKTGTTVLGTTNPIRLPSYDTTTIYTDTLTFVGCKLPISKSITVNPSPRSLRTFNATQCGPGVPPVSFKVRDSNGYTFPVIEWYANSVGGSPLQQGIDTIYLNPINTTTTLWVRIQNPGSGCWSARAPITLTITASDSILARANGVRDTFRLCQGIPINLTAVNVQSGGPTKSFDTFTWSGTVSGVSFPLKNTTGTQTINPTSGGSFPIYVDAIDTGTGCRARDTIQLIIQPNPFSGGQAFITASPNPACVGTQITHNLYMANSLATMPTYSLGMATTANSPAYQQIDTFQLGNFLNSSGCVGLTPAAGPAANGLPVSVVNRYSNYTSSTALAAMTTGPAVLNANSAVNFKLVMANANWTSTGWGTAVSIFIDYNRNGIIEVPAERAYMTAPGAYLTNSTGTACNPSVPLAASINVPSNVVSGPALCRVISALWTSSSSGQATGANAFPAGATWGETEDYVVTLVGAADTNQTKLSWTSSATGATVLGTNNTLVHPVTVNNQRYNVRMVNGLCIDSLKDTISTTVPPLDLNTINGVTSICSGETIRLSVTSTGGCIPHTYAWSMLSGAGTITPLGTGNLRDSVSFTATGASGARTIRCIVTGNNGARDTSDHVLSFNNPTPSAVVKDTICGLNSATLCATSSVTSDVLQWFSSPTSYQTLAEGICYTTPALNQETVFYVRQFTSLVDSCEPRSTMTFYYQVASGTYLSGNYGSRVRATKRVIIKSVEIVPDAAGASVTSPVTGTVNVGVYDQGGNLIGSSGLQTISIVNSSAASATATPVTIPLGVLVNPGDYDVRFITTTGIANCDYAQNSTGTNFQPQWTPSGSFGVWQGLFGGTTYLNYNFIFWNYKVEEGCWGAAIPDTVKYTAPPSLTLSRKFDTLCSLGSTAPVTLTSPSPRSTYSSYVWTPSTAIAGDSAIGYVFSESTPGDYTYVLRTSQATGLQCATTDTFKLNIKPIPPVISRTPATASVDLCNGTIQQLDALGFRLTSHVTGTATSTGSANGATGFNNNWGGQKTQIIITAAELSALPAASKTLKSITLKAGTVPSGASYPGFQIFVGHTTLANMTATSDINPYTGAGSAMTPITAGIMKRVYEAPAAGATYTPVTNKLDTFRFGTAPATPLNGPISNEFEWNKTDNIVILISWSNGTTNSPTTPLEFSTVASGFTPVMHRWPTTGPTMNNMATRTDGTSGTGGVNRPNMTLRFEDGAPITWSPTTSLFTKRRC